MRDGGIKKRIISGISANLLGQLLTVAVQLLGIPVYLSHWGTQYYGEWLLLFSIPSFLAMSDLGLGTVATTEMAMNVAVGHRDKAAQTFGAVFWTVALFGGLLSVLFVLGALVFPWHHWLGLQSFTPHESSLTFILLTAYVMGAIVLGLPLGIYRVVGYYGRGQMLNNLFRFAEFIAIIALIMLGCKALLIATAMMTLRWVSLMVVWRDVKKKAPWLSLFPIRWNWKIIRPLAKPSLSMITVYWGQMAVTQGLVTIIGITLGAAQVVVFSTIRTLCNFAKQIIGSINLSVFSEFSISIGNGDLHTARRLHTSSIQANFFLTLIAVAGLQITGAWIMSVWTKGAIDIDEPFFSLYLAYILFNSIWLGSWNMLLGCNQHVGLTRPYIIISMITLAASFFFCLKVMVY